MSWYNHPRVVAVGNLLGAAFLAALPYVMFPKPPDASFLRLWHGFIVLFSLFWVWIFIVNPREWAVVKDGRLCWRRGQLFPRSGSVDVAEVKHVLVETVDTSPQSDSPHGKPKRYYVVLKDDSKVRVPEQAAEHECLHSMRKVNPLIEKKEQTVPFSWRDPSGRA